MFIEAITEYLKTSHELTPFSVAVVMLAFLVSGLLPVPRAAVCVLAGAAYGVAAIPIAVPAATVGAVIAFLAARYIAAQHVQRLIGRKRLLRQISKAVDQEGWRIVALMRFAGPVPGFASNYLFGMTNIGLWPYTWATFIFCAPQVILFVCLGAAGRAALLRDSSSILGEAMIVAGVVTSALMVYLIAKRARSSFADLDDPDRSPTT
ncbi:VTT domain-containing protein [Bradyrhizobium sp. LHD-71]|uniref:TVP38/TMEM64 family protein n=1 Tax=Bradyrhizobium sp. LHD-71 TaxID=3072141 RepID=UPI00280FB759|nr:VTT domain-containing protein [Bradyrhizobium sp. LHD-71]MDQ8729471.1 VTT domain-containing protein [Bradyrhizobium sp. LHD-71]